VLAMALPIITALFGLGTGAALIALVANVVAVPEPTVQIAAMLGIGVGIDYALLIVTRYRAGLHDGLEPRDALVLSLDTSGRAVVFAGLTVAISLLGMFFFNSAALRSLATGALFGVLMTMFAAITLLPAMLGFIGRNIDRLRVPFLHTATEVGSAEGDRRSLWYRWSRVIQSRPWPPLILSTALLVILTIPVFSIGLGFADASNRLETDTTRKAYDILSEGFGVGFNGPILVVVETANGPSDSAAVAELKSSIEGTEGVASVSEPIAAANGRLQLINVFAESAPQDEATTELVDRLRDETIAPLASRTGIAMLTTGGPAFVVDFSDYMRDKLPIFIGAVLVLSFFLLTVVFHSVVVPLKAVLMNLLSIGAAFGAVVVVFQWGIGADLIGIREGPFEAWAPILLFAVVFGLSMDYEVFLLTRIREQYDRTGDNSSAVADGLAATGRVISAAALIMVCVFGSFTLGDMRPIKLLGFGLAFAVLIDATIVRLVLVPAAMELMGKANWWAPPWLVRYLPRFRVETVGQPVAHAEHARSSP
jgi:putative drug exporter of the RND superfamily